MASSIGSSHTHLRSRPVDYFESAVDIFDVSGVPEAFLRQNQVAHVVRVRKDYLAFSFKTFQLFVVVCTTASRKHLVLGLLLLLPDQNHRFMRCRTFDVGVSKGFAGFSPVAIFVDNVTESSVACTFAYFG